MSGLTGTAAPVSYFQSCPICGRALRISVNLIGSRVFCQHCGGGFVAEGDAPAARPASRPSRADAAARADELIAEATRVLQQAED